MEYQFLNYMMIYNKKSSTIAIVLISCITIFSGSLLLANAQPSISDNLPILLIHGYGEKANIWNWWIDWLGQDQFTKVYPITFTNDRCGSTEQHANELKNIIDNILSQTGSKQVNIVAHSKGGLDARWYIANNNIDKVANLIMIGTPNAGSPAAWWDISGCPFGSDSDLFPGSDATQVVDRPQSTNYYTIAGNWIPNHTCLSFFYPFVWLDGGNCFIPGPDDNFVPVDSVNSQPSYIPLAPPFPYDHFDLLKQKDVYTKVLPKLNG
jgi:pimeloyl-ACP methyl ester carboxylesterase